MIIRDPCPRATLVALASVSVLIVGCAEEPPLGPAASPTGISAAARPPEAPADTTPAGWSYRDLDADRPTANNDGYGVNPMGFVFVWGPTEAYSPKEFAVDRFSLPASPRAGGAGNRVGDYLGMPANLMVFDPVDTVWSAGPLITAPAGFGAGRPVAVNDERTVVGSAIDSSRYEVSRKGTVRRYSSALLWQLDSSGGIVGRAVLPLPAAHTGCVVSDVVARAINNSGRVVGSAKQRPVGGATCVERAVYWDPPYTSVPGELAPSAVPMAQPYPRYEYLHYYADDINDSGDVAGTVYVSVSNSYRAVRWFAGRYDRPEVLTGWTVAGTAIDECGRMVVGGVAYGAKPGIWPVGWDGKLEFPLPDDGVQISSARDISNGIVVGAAFRQVGTLHVYQWNIGACPGTP